MTKVVNFFAGPSAGKSTMALGLTHWMKNRRMNVEYVPEYPKQLTWDKRHEALEDQLYVFAKQHSRLYQLLGQVDWIVTDGPILQGLCYMDYGLNKFISIRRSEFEDRLKELVLSAHDQYENLNFFVDRAGREFVQAGRNQDEQESNHLDHVVKMMLAKQSVPFSTVKNLDQVWKALELPQD